MATILAAQNGNWNATSTWTGGVVPTTGDVAVANGKTITVNVNANLGSSGEVRTDTTGGATAGGSFVLSSNVTLTAHVYAGTATGVAADFQGGTGTSASIVGNVFATQAAGSSNFSIGARNLSSGTLNITGNVTGGLSANFCCGVQNNGQGTLNVTGNSTGGTSTNAAGISNESTGTVNITGNASAGSSYNANGISNLAGGTVNITGTVTGGSATSSGCHGVYNALSGTVNITGSVNGGTVADFNYGAYNVSTGNMTIVGTVTGGTYGAGAMNNSTGVLTATRAVGNAWGIGATGMVSTPGVFSNVVGSQTRVSEFEYGSLGQAPTRGAVSCPDATSNVCIVHRLGTTKKTLIDAASIAGALPAASNVRYGTTFNQGNTTGTCYVPAAGSVALGVPVDATTGTAVLTPSAVWDALTSGMTTSGSIGERLKNASTVATTGQQLSDALTP